MADTPMDLDDDDDGPTRQRPSDTAVSGMTTTKVILIAVVGVMLLGCCGVGGCVALLGVGSKRVADRETKEVAEGSALTFTADALHGEYDANEVAADGKYKGKTVEVTGTVKEIGKGAFGGQYVAFTLARNQFMTSVQCEFPTSAQTELAKLKKGQRVTIRGKCEGFLIKTVRLDNCSLK